LGDIDHVLDAIEVVSRGVNPSPISIGGAIRPSRPDTASFPENSMVDDYVPVAEVRNSDFMREILNLINNENRVVAENSEKKSVSTSMNLNGEYNGLEKTMAAKTSLLDDDGKSNSILKPTLLT